MDAAKILEELKALGTEGHRKILMNHGAREPLYGVKIEHMKKIVKRIGPQYELALALYDSGVFDAMYLAGLLADAERMTAKDLERWLKGAYCSQLSEYTVPWVAAESAHGFALAQKWIDAKSETAAAAGWSTLSSLAGITPDADLDLARYRDLLGRVAKTIHAQPNRVKYAMNGFVIATGSYIASLNALAKKTGAAIGTVQVDMNGTACKVPSAPEYIAKVEARGSVGKKRKDARC